MTKTLTKKTINDLKPNDEVLSCPYMEHGIYFAIDGARTCVNGTIVGRILATPKEINDKTVTYEKIINERKDLFAAVNGLSQSDPGMCVNCTNLKKKKFKDVCFDFLGGSVLAGGFGVQHYTMCNERCKYCWYAQNNFFKKPQYNVLDVLNLYNDKGRLLGNNFIDFSGGEPALLNDIDEILSYFEKNNLGIIDLYSNASIYSQKIYDLLKKDKIILTTSVDTGLRSTYANLRGKDLFPQVIENLIKYRNSGTKNLWLKYVITNDNRTEDDLWSFLMVMLAVRPNKVMISPDFPYGDMEIPDETVKFAAKLWYLLEKFLGVEIIDYTIAMGDIKFAKYREAMFKELDRLKTENPICECDLLKQFINSDIRKPTLLEQIFSVRNEGKHKVIRLLGMKFKFRRK